MAVAVKRVDWDAVLIFCLNVLGMALAVFLGVLAAWRVEGWILLERLP